MNVSYHSNHLLSRGLGEGIPNVTGGLLYNNSMTIHSVLVLQYHLEKRRGYKMRIVIGKVVLFVLLLVFVLLWFSMVALPAEIIFEDEFENLKEWTPSGNIKADDGVLKVRATVADGIEWSGVDTNEKFDNFAVYFDLKLVDLAGEGDSSFTFRKTGGSGYYMMFGSYGGGVIELEHLTSWNKIDDCGVDIPLVSDLEFKVRVVAEGKHIIIQVKDAEGNLVVDWDIEEDSYESGTLTFDNWKFGELDVTNFVVGTPDYLPEEWGGKPQKPVEPLGKLSATWGSIKTQP